MRDKVIVAVDLQEREQFFKLTDTLKGHATYIKVGMELYYTFGPDIIKAVKDLGYKVFLDLKIHDIPNTAFKAAKTLCKLGVDIINVHAAGGIEMMTAARLGVQEGIKESGQEQVPLLIGVTQLTSTSEDVLHNELLITKTMSDTVVEYALNVKKAGLDGVVCSAQDVAMIKEKCGKDFKCITPGIRPKSAQKDDQKRTMTPNEAIQIGSDYLVIGRPITAQIDPAKAFESIIEEIENE
jgi:orotidine-5'-phosphate decarboxylase